MTWRDATQLLPAGRHARAWVLAVCTERHAPTIIVARYVAARTETGDYEGDDAEYDEAADVYYWPAGWYEQPSVYGEEPSWRVAVSHWMPLPALPDGVPLPECGDCHQPSVLCRCQSGDA